MGNLESAAGNLDEAVNYFNKAIANRISHGDSAATLLANSYLCLSRAYFLRGEYKKALDVLAQSESLFFRIAGGDSHFMAQYETPYPTTFKYLTLQYSVHYAYGNIEFEQKRWITAMKYYETSLRIGLAKNAIHPITAAAYYSLGCVEFEMKHHDRARYDSISSQAFLKVQIRHRC